MKVTVIGAGFGQYAMAPVYEKLGFEVEVVTPRDPEAVNRALSKKVDLISIHSPPFMHHDMVMRALDHGQNVLCDKPFGKSLAEAQAMRDRAHASGQLHFLNFEVREKPNRAKIKALIDAGAIGKPLHLNWTFYSNGYRHGAHGWVSQKEMGGGWVNGYSSHCIDFMRWIFDSEVAKCGGLARIEVATHPDKDGVPQEATAEDAYSAWFLMENGCTAVQDTAYGASVAMPMTVTVMGSEGGLELVGDTKIIVRRATQDLSKVPAAERIRLGLLAQKGEEYDFPPAPGEAHEPALIPWLTKVREALRTSTQISPSFDDGLLVSKVMDQFKRNLILAG
jgi:predicted dehydrogenase